VKSQIFLSSRLGDAMGGIYYISARISPRPTLIQPVTLALPEIIKLENILPLVCHFQNNLLWVGDNLIFLTVNGGN
jgi:hypothetical protein